MPSIVFGYWFLLGDLLVPKRNGKEKRKENEKDALKQAAILEREIKRKSFSLFYE